MRCRRCASPSSRGERKIERDANEHEGKGRAQDGARRIRKRQRPKDRAEAGGDRRRGHVRLILPARQKARVAEPEPNVLASLLVATAATGSSPASASAGNVSNPPPPATASTKPDAKPTSARTAMNQWGHKEFRNPGR